MGELLRDYEARVAGRDFFEVERLSNALHGDCPLTISEVLGTMKEAQCRLRRSAL